ncbi:MAG: UDP-N-acetylglucosamine 2-epimerase [Roseimicrobium sp.]
MAVLTTGRQDWGILRGLCKLLEQDAGFELRLMVGGMHNSSFFGRTKDIIIEEGFKISEELGWVPDAPPLLPHIQAGDALRLVAQALQRQRPDALVLLGDRFETAAAALAATLERVPLIHLHGGEETLGAMDNALRHAITKLSHLHFTSHPIHAARVIALGEDPATVHVVGAPGLDNLHRDDIPSREALEAHLGIPLHPPVVLVTLHPATLSADLATEVSAVTQAMQTVNATYVITLPNSDPGNEAIRAAMIKAADSPNSVAVEALGEKRFWSLMRESDAMLGNSSSAIIEAPALGLPAVNVGDRQKGRVRGSNVLDAKPEAGSIAAALRQALSSEFRAAAHRAPSPFGNGDASQRMMDVLRRWIPPHPPLKTSILV